MVDSPPELPRCSCGHDRNHPVVVTKNHYTFWGYVALFTGISAKPILTEYKCTQCGEVFDSTTDPQVLNRYI